ncbi:predicted protein [Chaetomium globosum CBS 148.51]|uniref:Uncharacterized protein n=1 Tax=Chaetomium globosum (strain ATCC 6205 / CBS 148.51 / DSM 1962 / NBRC 6347 / NRRL 1970) TaxID=306901 RepID=Q2HFL0_CHAGB|nr:uncharacterized protein CHGG_00994 [Chaetomium globosum CBS 148.51]EAQ92759.1 predicted protein [Chaetomium globosum CBS 148.51]
MPASPVQRLPDTQLPLSSSHPVQNPVLFVQKSNSCSFPSLSITTCLAATSSSPSDRMK